MHNPITLGFVFMLGFAALAPLADGIAKGLSLGVSVAALAVARFAVQSVVLVPIVILRGGFQRYNRTQWSILFARALLHLLGIILMFVALRYMPLADAISITFIMPFIVLILSANFLNERVSRYQITLCGFAFLGALFISQPGFNTSGWASFLPFAVAFIYAVFMILTRQIAQEIHPIEMQATCGLMALFILLIGPFLWSGFEWHLPDGSWILWLLAVGGLGTVAHLMLSWALLLAPASSLAPLQYLELPFAALYGVLLFGQFPNWIAGSGIVIVVGTGLLLIRYEHAKVARP